MADPQPLLFQLSDHTTDSHHDQQYNKKASMDELIEQTIGKFGWAQVVQAILVSLASIFDSQQAFLSVYTDAEPTWHCINNCDSSNSNICSLPADSEWTWDGIASKTIISEWGLECSTAFIRGLPASSHFMGCILGTFLVARLADSSLGRKNMLFLSCLMMSITTSITILCNNVWIYSLMRFVTGVGRASIGTCTIVLLMEKVGRKWRNLVGIMDFFFFTTGIVSLPAIAYMNRDSSWRTIYLWTSVPALVYSAFLYVFVSESPRWLLMQGREEEAMKTLESLSTLNDIKLRMSSALYVGRKTSKVDVDDRFSSIKDLFGRRWARRRILALIIIGFGIGLTYYGMTLGIGNLGFGIYLSVVFNGMIEISSFVVTYLVIEKWNRKSSLLIMCVASGIFSLMIILVGDERDETIKIGLELASFFGACMAYNMIMIYAIELFPTCVRNFATSMARQAITFGAVLSSILVAAGGDNKLVAYVVFGIVILCCGFFVVCLPETKGAPLFDTMDEQERHDNIDSIVV
ncbi:hypothetical protein LWI29_010998 [Acer saccharum]|uniref:Major facilitator superfamily (MFS) profile domain-containing protein n=1 Tax=Acer saccharum TaxID=4024 RepID=A0AA39SPI2_ACESA|nr:hypothetical protein LWI29_010998 [Acer saccharum]